VEVGAFPRVQATHDEGVDDFDSRLM